LAIAAVSATANICYSGSVAALQWRALHRHMHQPL